MIDAGVALRAQEDTPPPGGVLVGLPGGVLVGLPGGVEQLVPVQPEEVTVTIVDA